MKENTKLTAALVIILVAGLFAVTGCILDPEKDPEPEPVPPPAWGDLTEKEHTLKNLVQSYTYRDIEHYQELLHAEYVWFLQDGDYEPGEDNYFVRQKDINMTSNMFDAANAQYEPVIDKLTLDIDPADWYSVSSIGEKDCEDGECWQTERGYYLVVHIGEMTYIGDDIIIVNIAKDPVTQKYSIMSIYDIDK